MIEIEKDEKVVFKGTKEQASKFLSENGLDYKADNIPLLILGHLATGIGYDVFCR